jgi:hypothetical protein
MSRRTRTLQDVTRTQYPQPGQTAMFTVPAKPNRVLRRELARQAKAKRK